MPEQRVTAMKDFLRPKSKKDLHAFLGSIGYYRRFIPNIANWSSVLSPHTSSKAPGQVIWSTEMVDAFHQLCVSLCDFSVLNVPIMSDAYVLHTDASGRGVGGVLNVLRDGEENSQWPITADGSKVLRCATLPQNWRLWQL